MIERRQLTLNGIVQGVGMRPTIAKHALDLKLSGRVYNASGGVVIEIQGPVETLNTFTQTLLANLPASGRIDTISSVTLPAEADSGFVIEPSQSNRAATMIPPDISVCQACEEEFFDPRNRRYRDPFINCTHCGPRYSIIKTLPFDRSTTSMDAFAMCHACKQEYDNPQSRRFHAQGICCPACGPKITPDHAQEAFVSTIQNGGIAAVKGIGGFHLLCDATHEAAVARLRTLKQRPSKPLGVLFKTSDMLEHYALIDDATRALLQNRAHPMAVVPLRLGTPLAQNVSSNLTTVGAMLPYAPLYHWLLETITVPLVATSANLSGMPIITDEATLKHVFGAKLGCIVSHDRIIANGCDDSVITGSENTQIVVRMGRGMAPYSRPLTRPATHRILALGAHQKGAFGIAFETHCILSAHMGELEDLPTWERFLETIEAYQVRYGLDFDVVVSDMHPHYATTKWAKNYAQQKGIPWIQVQHHEAHVLACMAEHALSETVIGCAFDGSGLGHDGTIWGGEVLLGNQKGFTRVGHVRPFRLLGGAKAVQEPRRVALALLFECFSLDEVLILDNPALQAFSAEEIRALHNAWRQEINAPITSSMGRLFDAIASLLGVVQVLDYEGQSGMMLETLCLDGAAAFSWGEDIACFDWEPAVRAIVANPNPKLQASRFMESIVDYIASIAMAYADYPMVLSGGVFQNQTLVARVTETLKDRPLYLQRKTPINDGGIALGQLYYALGRLDG